MKQSVRLLIIGGFAVLFLALTTIRPVFAQTVLTSEQRDRISANCLTIKNSLNQLHASDALLRVNRGQIYESIGTKLMNNFNARLASNSLDARGLQAVTLSYQNALAAFRADYQTYERQLSAVIRIDCSTRPDEFHAAVESARAERQKVHADVIRLHQQIDDYRSAVNDFLINYERVAGDES